MIRVMMLPPWALVCQLLDFTNPLPYDVVHVFGPLCLAFVPLLPLFYMRSVKVYVSYHVYLEFYKEIYLGSNTLAGAFIEFIFCLLYFIPLTMWADMIGIPSKTADGIVFRYAKRIHIMKSGLQTDVFKPLEDQHQASPWWSLVPRMSTGPTLVYVGRLAGEKDVEFLVRALAHPKLFGYTLVIVGDGPSRRALEKLACKVVGPENVLSGDKAECISSSDSAYVNEEDEDCVQAVQPRSLVIFTGMILSEDVVAKHYAHADVFVSASASETFGFTVAEAMACATPAVVVRSGAFKNVYQCIDDWMFEPHQTDDYVAKVTKVVAQGQKAREFSRKVAVKKFGVERAIHDLLTTYQMMVDDAYPENTTDNKIVDLAREKKAQLKKE